MAITIDDIVAAGRTTRRAVRLWEYEGLFGPIERAPRNFKRIWAPEHIERAKVIAAAQMTGMGLDEIRIMMKNPNVSEISAAIDDAVKFLQNVQCSMLLAKALEYDL